MQTAPILQESYTDSIYIDRFAIPSYEVIDDLPENWKLLDVSPDGEVLYFVHSECAHVVKKLYKSTNHTYYFDYYTFLFEYPDNEIYRGVASRVSIAKFPYLPKCHVICVDADGRPTGMRYEI